MPPLPRQTSIIKILLYKHYNKKFLPLYKNPSLEDYSPGLILEYLGKYKIGF
jgi:hypothetical protein